MLTIAMFAPILPSLLSFPSRSANAWEICADVPSQNVALDQRLASSGALSVTEVTAR